MGNVFFAISQWAILLIINKLGSAEDVGIFTLSLAITTPIFIFFQFGLRSLIVIDTNYKFKFSHYYSVRLFLSIIAFICAIFFCFYREEYLSIIFIAGYKLFDSLFDIHYGDYQRRMAYNLPAKSKIIRGITSVILFFITYISTNSLNLSLFTYFLSSFIVFYFYDFSLSKEQYSKIISNNKLKMKELFLSSLPLAITAFLISLNSSFPRLYLEGKEGLVALGAFASFSHLIIICQILVQSLCQTFSPKLSKSYHNGDYHDFRILSIKLLGMCVLLSLLFVLPAIVLKEYIFYLFFNKSFNAYKELYEIIIYISPLIFISTAIGYICTAKQKIKYQPYIFILIFLINIIFCYYFYDSLGIYIATYSMGIVALMTILFTSIYIFFRERR